MIAAWHGPAFPKGASKIKSSPISAVAHLALVGDENDIINMSLSMPIYSTVVEIFVIGMEAPNNGNFRTRRCSSKLHSGLTYSMLTNVNV